MDQVSTDQITTTARFRIDTRFNEYISHANPKLRPVLRELRDEILRDLSWIALRSSGAVAPLNRTFNPSARIEAKVD